MIRLLLPALLLLLATGCGHKAANYIGMQDVVSHTQDQHGLVAWWGKDSMSADVQVTFGGNKMIDGTFVWQANAPKARHEAQDGSVTVFDGQDCWVTPASAADPSDRFHVLTWPWFIMAPYKMRGDGIKLSDYRDMTLANKTYHTVLQTFESGTGDTPEDWYRFFIDPDTYEIAAMAYIVTYGKSAEQANQQASIIIYDAYKDIDGCRISTRWFFHYWDEEEGLGKSKGSGSVSNLHFTNPVPTTYIKPVTATAVPLPEANR